MTDEGTGPHFESVAQNKLVCLAPPNPFIISAFRRRAALINLFGKGFSLPSSPVRSWTLSRVPTWTGVQELGSSKGVFLNNVNSEYND